MLDGIVHKSNLVPERQRLYQNSHAPLYVRGPRSRLYLTLYLVGWTTGLLGAVGGAYSLIKGKPSA